MNYSRYNDTTQQPVLLFEIKKHGLHENYAKLITRRHFDHIHVSEIAPAHWYP